MFTHQIYFDRWQRNFNVFQNKKCYKCASKQRPFERITGHCSRSSCEAVLTGSNMDTVLMLQGDGVSGWSPPSVSCHLQSLPVSNGGFLFEPFNAAVNSNKIKATVGQRWYGDLRSFHDDLTFLTSSLTCQKAFKSGQGCCIFNRQWTRLIDIKIVNKLTFPISFFITLAANLSDVIIKCRKCA